MLRPAFFILFDPEGAVFSVAPPPPAQEHQLRLAVVVYIAPEHILHADVLFRLPDRLSAAVNADTAAGKLDALRRAIRAACKLR